MDRGALARTPIEAELAVGASFGGVTAIAMVAGVEVSPSALAVNVKASEPMKPALG